MGLTCINGQCIPNISRYCPHYFGDLDADLTGTLQKALELLGQTGIGALMSNDVVG